VAYAASMRMTTSPHPSRVALVCQSQAHGPSLDTDREAAGLCAYLDASPSPFHACAEAAERLGANGFARLDETERWSRDPGRYYAVRGGSFVAWSTEYADGDATPFRVVGAHSDSPNLRIKPHPDVARAGWRLLGVEVYGGPLLNSWLDRDLGLSGRVVIRDAAGTAERLLVVDDPILRIAQLAVHLDREVNEAGVKLNPQQHLAPIWGVGTEPGDFAALLADTVGCERDDILGWDVMTHDLTPSRRIGQDRELIAAPRLDNLATCYAGVRALAAAVEAPPASPQVPVLVLFDHEENGSMSERGAFSTLLPAVLERIVQTRGGGREDYLRALGGTVIASGDMAHATHPNYRPP
jgi:aspartyl aminopeptidase